MEIVPLPAAIIGHPPIHARLRDPGLAQSLRRIRSYPEGRQGHLRHTMRGLVSGRSAPCAAPRASRAAVVTSRRQVRAQAQAGGPGGGPEDLENLRQKYFTSGDAQQPSPSGQEQGEAGVGERIDAINPYSLGRKARSVFDATWKQLAQLGSPTKSSFIIDDILEPGAALDFQAPQAAYTTVLIIGATGRVGRILTRKLLLRGYKVKALVRKREGRQDIDSIPAAVEIVEGDVGVMRDAQAAVRGVNKVRRALMGR
jgi:hypothetical protein